MILALLAKSYHYSSRGSNYSVGDYVNSNNAPYLKYAVAITFLVLGYLIYKVVLEKEDYENNNDRNS